MIEGYLRGSPMLRGIVQLLDVRHDPTNDDIQMLDFLSEVGVPTMIVMTKTDKLSKAAAAERIASILASLGLDEDQVIPFSSVTGLGLGKPAVVGSQLQQRVVDRGLRGEQARRAVNGRVDTEVF